MTIDDIGGTLRALDDLTDGQITGQLYDDEFEERWDDVVAGVEWLATAKARSRGADAPEIQDVFWCLPTLELVPYAANEMWWMSGESLDDEFVLTEDDDRTAVRRIRASLFRDASTGAAIPVLVSENSFRAIESSLFEFLVPHPETPVVLVSIGELHYKLHNAGDVAAYIEGLGE